MQLQRRQFDTTLNWGTIAFIGWGILIAILVVSSFIYRSLTSKNQSEENSAELPTYSSRLSTNSNTPLNNEHLSDEFVDPLPLYSPPINQSQVVSPTPSNESNTVQIVIIPPNEPIERAPTYRK